MNLKHLASAIVVFILGSLPSMAQDWALKTNLLYDALLSPTVGVEVGLAPKWSADLSGTINNWSVNDRRWKQWMLQPEARYWFCQRFSGHFVGAHVLGGQFNFGNLPFDFKFLGTDFSALRDKRYQGWVVGAGVAYGYSWILSRHWNLEAEIGIGWVYSRFDEYNCSDCGKKTRSDLHHNYFGPTKAALNIIYVF